jgi:hypothetical protein
VAKPWIKVTRKDIEDAIVIGEILGGFDEAFPDGVPDRDLCCLVNFVQLDAEHCPTCSCKSDDHDECDHRDGIWECIAASIGASPEAELLWMHVSNIVSDLHPDAREIDKYGEPIKSWLASLVDESSRCDRYELNSNLETAALLHEGLLPPDVVVVSRKQKKRSATKGMSA